MKTCKRSDLLDFVVPLRDLATSLTGDPVQGNAVMRKALRELARDDPKKDITGERALRWLSDRVLCICLEQSGCVKCAADFGSEKPSDGQSIQDPQPTFPEDPDPVDGEMHPEPPGDGEDEAESAEAPPYRSAA